MHFRTKDIYWDGLTIPNIMEKLKNEEISDDLKLLLTELDRRLIQLWDKVVFERKLEESNG